ncbi:MAG: CDP-diacylglycerol--glycerol-3-phosphate 3-phosphatidyltransferase [Candidatus Aenigmatarchaeota archaeon]|nr:MAG: CDP-diacylglycerol--glycerol-3-phosphate 3-phosphatidyltransferase [Candidatus Aenigmarchaeota archaeon]HDH87654.1 CDP-alcohol phosphatidyltransferase family protein [Desulfobacteraceae bacterium]
MTIPNLITILRVLLVPIFVIYIINDRTLGSLIIFVIASISDALDGFIARVFHRKSDLGAYLDPLADKILLVTAYTTLAILKMTPPWLAVLIISRDVIILLGVLVLYLNRHPVKVHPSLLSKSTTCLQVATILMILSNSYLNLEPIKIYTFWLTAGFTIASGLQYIRIGLVILTQGEKTNFA